MNLIIWLVALFLSFSVYAEEQGGLAIVTVPADAEIYVNGELKANSSPAYLILSEGKYQVEVKKPGKKTETLEIAIGKDTVVKKEVVLSDMPSEQPEQPKLSLTAMLNPVRDSFETDEEFQQRRENLLKQFNEAVQRHETAFQAGIATLNKEKYDIHTGVFPVQIEWAEWAKQYALSDVSAITVTRDDAKAMWAEGAQKPVFLYMQLVENTMIKLDKQVILAREREWTTAKYATFSLQVLNVEIRSLSFSEDNTMLATSNVSDSVLVWKLNSQKLLESNLVRLSPSSQIYFHPKKPVLATISVGTARLENLRTEKTEQTFTTDFLFMFGGAFSPEGDMLAIANSAKITLWDTETGVIKHTFNHFEKQAIRIAYATDGKTLAVINDEAGMDIVDIETGNILNHFEMSKLTPEQVLGFATTYRPSLWDNFVVNQEYVAKIAADKQSVILKNNTTQETLQLVGRKSDIVVLAFSPNGSWLAAGRKEGSTDLWRLR
jgi:hypothetical protein